MGSDPGRMDGLARAAMRLARPRVLGAVAEVRSLFHYGAADIDTQHLIVWVLLGGDPELLQPHYLPSEGELQEKAATGEDLASAMVAARDLIIEAFRSVGWPEPEAIHVGFDSDERAAVGGHAYWK